MGTVFDQTRNDSVLILPQDLEAIDERLFQPKEAELKARRLLPVKSDIPLGAETYSYDILTRRGAAEIYTRATTRIPLVDVDMNRISRKIETFITGFQLTTFEIQQARLAGKPVETYKADAARRATAALENAFALLGDVDLGVPGLINAPGIQIIPAPNNAAGVSSLWQNKTSFEIINDVRLLMNAINQFDGHVANILAVAPNQFSMLQNPVSANDTRTIERYILDNRWFPAIISLPQLAGAGIGGADCALAMESARDVAELVIPGGDIQREEPVRIPLGYEVPVYEKCAGAVVRYPLAIARMDGI